ncbi:MAG: adenylyl-sulfate kinase [Phycisphaerales bacterium]|nr:adenylyl-sulfate kinase [Phycisphaerales bacterium]
MSSDGFTVWFTGLTGSGKSTLARKLHNELTGRGHQCEVLDSGRIRQALNRSLGFTRDEIEQAMQRIAYECKLLNRNGIIAIVAAVSPYSDVREKIRKDIGRFVEVYCRCPMGILRQRDEKDLIGRAQRGEIQHVAGVNAPYEEPDDPQVLCDTEDESAEIGVQRILATLERLGYLPAAARAAYTAQEEEIIKRRMQDLGYL